jgi:beta-glucosidase/6-phospho-beta-glucosidase/beta-galactosidase
MLTLFHHSLPLWLVDQGGWKNEKSQREFVRFSEACAKAFGDLVDDWIPFNPNFAFNFPISSKALPDGRLPSLKIEDSFVA